MDHRPPSHEELVDLAWLLDSALVVGNRERAAELAGRLGESLVRYHQHLTRDDPDGHAAVITTCRRVCLALSGELASLPTRLRGGGNPPRLEFRHRIQRLVDRAYGCDAKAC